MAQAFFSGETLDDVMHDVVKEAIAHGQRIVPTKGEALDLNGVLLEISNPRARISRTEGRGRLFSGLGELCWYLSGRNDLGFIFYYLKKYKKAADGDAIYGGYGPRLFDWKAKGVHQVSTIIDVLSRKSDSRQAVIQLFDATDLLEKHNDIPCTCTLQLLIRNGRLHMVTSMRSNDIHFGMPHDIFCFTMMQEIVARTLSVEMGTYKHCVGSLHLYLTDIRAAKRFLNEGFQPTEATMPAMPPGDPWSHIQVMLSLEAKIREDESVDEQEIAGLPAYWADLVRLLQVFHCKQSKGDKGDEVRRIRGLISNDMYRPLVDRVLRQLEVRKSIRGKS